MLGHLFEDQRESVVSSEPLSPGGCGLKSLHVAAGVAPGTWLLEVRTLHAIAAITARAIGLIGVVFFVVATPITKRPDDGPRHGACSESRVIEAKGTYGGENSSRK